MGIHSAPYPPPPFKGRPEGSRVGHWHLLMRGLALSLDDEHALQPGPHSGPCLRDCCRHWAPQEGLYQGRIRKGEAPPSLQGAMPMPSHYFPDGNCQIQWHL